MGDFLKELYLRSEKYASLIVDHSFDPAMQASTAVKTKEPEVPRFRQYICSVNMQKINHQITHDVYNFNHSKELISLTRFASLVCDTLS